MSEAMFHGRQTRKGNTVHLEITSRQIQLPETVTALIQKKAENLQRLHSRITGCRVVVENPGGNSKNGVAYAVHVDLTVPGSELMINRQQAGNIPAAVRQAFAAARRQLEDYVGRRGECRPANQLG